MMAQEIKKQDGFIRTFSVDLSKNAVWEAVCRPDVEGEGHYFVPGFEAVCSALEIVEGETMQPTDLIVRLNGTRVLHNLQLMDLLRMSEPGNELNVEWIRDGTLCQASQRI